MAIDRTGISSLQTGAPEITYTGDEGPKSPDEQLMAQADPILVEQYQQYVFEMEEQGLQPMSFREFVQQAVAGMAEGGIARLGYKDGYSVQGGVKNYLGNQETVSNVPVKWKSGPGKPETELAYITKAEKDLILKKDLHGSLKDGPNMGPGGLMSLDSWGDIGGGGQAGADVSDSGGGGGRDPSTTYSYDPVAAAQQQAKEVEKSKVDNDPRISPAKAEKIKAEIDAEPFYDPYQLGPGAYMDEGVAVGDQFYADTTTPALAPDDAKSAYLQQQAYESLSPDQKAGITAGDASLYESIAGTQANRREFTERELERGETETGERIEFYNGIPVTTSEAYNLGLKSRDPNDPNQIVPGRNVFNESGDLVPATGIGTTGLGDTGGIGTGGTGTNVPGTPIVPTGITAAEAAQSFEDAKAAEIAKVQAAAASGAPFEHYYVGGDPTAEQEKFMQEQGAAASMVGKEAWPAAYGGRARQRYGLGSLVKSITKPIKKILKSPIGKAALLGGLGLWGGQAGLFGKGIQDQGWKKFLGSKILGTATRTKHPEGHIIEGDRVGGLWNWIKDNPMLAIAGLSATPFLFQEEYPTDIHPGTGDYGKKLDLLDIRKRILDKKGTREEFPYLNPDQYAPRAQGGRIGYQDGRSVRSVALNQLYGIMPKRKLAQEGGLMDLGGMEKDYRNEGGFVPIGGQERADDVPARLSKNEFVFTADAVRAAGGGDIDKGAEVMENMMENLEKGGKVSEESQGLKGARDMFATAQRLEGVL